MSFLYVGFCNATGPTQDQQGILCISINVKSIRVHMMSLFATLEISMMRFQPHVFSDARHLNTSNCMFSWLSSFVLLFRRGTCSAT